MMAVVVPVELEKITTAEFYSVVDKHSEIHLNNTMSKLSYCK